MNRQILKSLLVILGVSSAASCIGIGIYVFIHPELENAQFLLQLSFFLLLFPIPIALILDRLRR